MRVFLDTNVLVSAVATRGLCGDILREILVSHRLVVSAPLIAELKHVLRTKIGVPKEVISDFEGLLTQDAILCGDSTLTNVDINDKDDILLLSTALNGNAQLFVTGDKELLGLEKVESMGIVSPREFWEILKTQAANEH
jgi:putative PIN family toxin of toxin-antitoxin system